MSHRKETLIIQTAFLGDCVLTLPLINTLKNCPSTGRVSVICRPEFRAVFKSCPQADEVISFDKNGKDKGLGGTLRLVKKIKRKNFNRVFLPQRSFRSGFIAAAARIPERIGFKRGGASLFLTSRTNYDWSVHEVERLLNLAEAAGCSDKKREYCLMPDKDLAENYSRDFKRDDRKVVGIAPQSVWPTKRWPAQRYRELIDSIKDRAQIVIFGSQKEEWPQEAVNLTSRTSIKELIAAISQIDLLVSNDSGVMHIAAALGKTAVVIFGATVPELGFAPYGSQTTIIEKDLDCRPCGLHGPKRCPRGHFKCMKDIKVETVREAVLGKL
ncbi:MAG: lipopolysaccharide heptosyltransferase II [Elusimicrobiota bacterium]|nr:lipopolysaccharide heptosyltransferase II [Elusimicrobiota bacterium]